MRRRGLIVLLGGAMLAWPLKARAQQKAMPVIGILGLAPGDVGPAGAALAAFRRGLGEEGYAEGKNVAIEYRWADNHHDRLPALAAELVARQVDVIVNEGGDPSAIAAKNATSTIPIVFHSGEATASSLVANFARPGGNLTGVTTFAGDLLPKMFELILEAVGHATMTAILINPNGASTAVIERAIRVGQEAAHTLGVQLLVLKAVNESEIDAAFATIAQRGAGALVVGGDGFFSGQRHQLVRLASQYSVPAIYVARFFTDAGGLLSYGAPITEGYRLKGIYTGKILKGAKPADLPIIRPSKFELIINLKTAKALGLTIPQSLFARADEVIE
jgi:putative tryptophan/tyrosine transport system substrate-binding protein